jgi:hypothetical protein
MKKDDLEMKIIKLIGLYDYLITINATEAYHHIRKQYQILVEKLKRYETIQDVDVSIFDTVLNVFRIYLEAGACKDSNLDKYILDKMQEIYLLQKEIENIL